MLTWTVQTVKLSHLKDYQHNPRKITKAEMDKLVTSLREDGYHQRFLVNNDHTLIGGHQRKKALLMVTDPPYGVNYDPEWRERADKGVNPRSKGKVLNDDRADWTEAYKLFPGDVAYVWHPSHTTHLFAQHLESCGFSLITLIIWAKQHFVLSRGDYHNQHELLWYASRPQAKKQKKADKPDYTATHEPLWYATKKGKKHNWQGRRDQTTVWDIANNNRFGNPHMEEKFGHGTQKPLECMLRPILNNSAKGQEVYDPFCGSGTTLIACEKSDRICYAMELSPAYVDMTLARWEKETGREAVLEKP
jgi:site-specific DNA-methyltransferase (adenine-specific)